MRFFCKKIFLPGFSTNKQLSRISGRGVGMSAVREMLGEVGGEITVLFGDEERSGYRSIGFTFAVPRRLVIALREVDKIAA